MGARVIAVQLEVEITRWTRRAISLPLVRMTPQYLVLAGPDGGEVWVLRSTGRPDCARGGADSGSRRSSLGSSSWRLAQDDLSRYYAEDARG